MNKAKKISLVLEILDSLLEVCAFTWRLIFYTTPFLVWKLAIKEEIVTGGKWVEFVLVMAVVAAFFFALTRGRKYYTFRRLLKERKKK